MKNKRGQIWILLGLLLITAALAITGYNFWEDRQAEINVSDAMMQLRVMVPVQMPAEEADAAVQTLPQDDRTALRQIPEEIPDYILNPRMEMPKKAVNGYDYIGIVEIPACSIELPIIANWSYPALKVAPCRFEGSVYTGDLILAGHDYKSHFRGLRDLAGGEKVLFTDMDGNVFSFTVTETETISGSDMEGLQAGTWDLTLFTCTADGASRIVVRCETNTDV